MPVRLFRRQTFLQKHSILQRHIPLILRWLVVVGILFFHIWQLADVPRGLYVDESSIGLNAALLAESGVDEHGVAWPTYFEAFGEYKNPIYIYMAAGLFKLFGVSEFTLRLTSFVFFYIFLFFLSKLVTLQFKKQPIVWYFAVISAGFLPWFFNLSRIGFEVISQLTLVTVVVYLIKITYTHHRKIHWPWSTSLNATHQWLLALSCGATIGLSVYTYSTARLLSALLVLSVLIVYRSKEYWLIHIKMLLGLILAMIPLFTFVQQHPEALTARFHEVTYLYSDLPIGQKLLTFLQNYVSYLSPEYLIYQGDTIMRHHPGPGGGVFAVVGVLAVVGLIWVVQKWRNHQFEQVLVLNLALAPVAAALTTGDSSLRSILIGLYLLIFATYGFSALSHIQFPRLRNSVLIAVFGLLSLEGTNYVLNYFTEYRDSSVWAFESYSIKKSLLLAKQHATTDVLMSEHGNRQATHLAFYLKVLGWEHDAISIGPAAAAEGRCVIISAFDGAIKGYALYELTDYSVDGEFAKVLCFGSKRRM